MLYYLKRFAPWALRLTVAAWNQRAIRLYHNAGFQEQQRFEALFSDRTFLVMLRQLRPWP